MKSCPPANQRNKIVSFSGVIVFVLLFTGVLTAQNLNPTNSLPNQLDENSNFFEIQKTMGDYWNSKNIDRGYKLVNGKKVKVPNWKLYQRWEYFWEQRVNLETGEFPKTSSAEEYQKFLSKNSSQNTVSAFNESWTNLGTNSSSGGYAGIGRINCIAFHPTDANTFWVGSPSGGIWVTTNGGGAWTNLNDDQSVLGVSSIVVNSDYATSPTPTLYIATGDRDGGSMWTLSGGQAADNTTDGVYKSTDGGSSWVATDLTFSTSTGARITKLLIHPSNNNIIFASVWDYNNTTASGIWKSVNGGGLFTKVSTGYWMDMEFKPGDPTIMYASGYDPFGGVDINKSVNSGDAWSSSTVAASGYRGELAVTAAAPGDVYLLTSNSNGGVEGIYRSTDSGGSWANAWSSGTPSGMCGYYTDGSGGNGGQGEYDLCIAVDPLDELTVYIGGITTWKSVDGGVNWSALTNWTSSSTYNKTTPKVPVVHADKHTLAFQSSTVLFEGNDGGIYKTADGGSNWTDLSNGLVISQIYRLGVSQTSSTTVITGLQDNGSKLFSGGGWADVTGGDGMECIVDYSDANYQYATYVKGEIYLTTNSWTGYTTISANITGGQPTGAWVTPYIIDPNANQTLYAGYDVVWKTTNRGTNWSSISQTLSSSDKLRSLAIAPSNSSVIYTADRSNMWKTTDGGATTWSSITLPAGSNYITYIAVKDDDPNTVWITRGGYTSGDKVYKSVDGGANWTNISTGLPNLPVMCIVHYKDITSKEVLFVGTDVGIYVKDGTNDWASYSTGLPNVVVSELEIYYTGSTDKLRAATFGRGLWETDINAPLPVELSAFEGSLESESVLLEWETATETNNFGFDVERGLTETEFEKIGFVLGNGTTNSSKSYSFSDGELPNVNEIWYRLKQIDNDGQFEYSKTIHVDISAITGIEDEDKKLSFGLAQNYPNPFNPETKISYSVPTASAVNITVVNVLGEVIARLVSEVVPSGNHEALWNASKFSSGVYIYKIQAIPVNGDQPFTAVRKMILAK